MPCAFEGGAKLRLDAAECQLRRRAEPRRRRRKAECADDELVRQPLERSRGAVTELLPGVLAARLPFVGVVDLHAAGVVDEHGEKVLLRHRRLDDQHRTEEAEREQRDEGYPDREEQWRGGATAVAQDGKNDRDAGQAERHIGARAGRQAELSLLKDNGPIFEEKSEQRFEQGISTGTRYLRIVPPFTTPVARAAFLSRVRTTGWILRSR